MSTIKVQRGQSITEFVIAAGVLSMFLITLPMISKIGTMKLKTEQAADYAAWRVNKGINTQSNDELSREIGQRFFSRTGSDVLSDRNSDCDDMADKDLVGNSLVSWDKVKGQTQAKAERYGRITNIDPLKTAAQPFGNLSSNGQNQISIEVPLSTITGIPGLPDSMVLKSSRGTLRHNWAAKNSEEIKKSIKNSIYLKAYELVQVNTNSVYNHTVASLGFEKKIRTDGIYKMDIVPTDKREVLR